MVAFINTYLANEFMLLVMTVVVMFVGTSLFDDVSRIGATLLGVGLIAIAFWMAFDLQYRWLPFVHAMADPKVIDRYRLAPDQLVAVERNINLLLWLVPYVTASWGTNILSSAWGQRYRYQAAWGLPNVALRTCVWLMKCVWFVLSLPVRICRALTPKVKNVQPKVGDDELDRAFARSRRHSKLGAILKALSDLPQFESTSMSNESLRDITSGAIVRPATLKEDPGSRSFMIEWQQGGQATQLNAEQYADFQILLASSLGANVSKARTNMKKALSRSEIW